MSMVSKFPGNPGKSRFWFRGFGAFKPGKSNRPNWGQRCSESEAVHYFGKHQGTYFLHPPQPLDLHSIVKRSQNASQKTSAFTSGLLYQLQLYGLPQSGKKLEDVSLKHL